MYKTILLAIDLNEVEAQAKSIGTAIEQARTGGATLHVANVLPDYGMTIVGSFFPEGFEQKMLEEEQRRLEAWAGEALPDDIEVSLHILKGTIYEEILKAATAIKADLIVLSAHRPDLKDFLLGPNAARVVRHAACSVLVVRE